MPLNLEHTRTLLQSFDLKALFIEELGWDRYKTELDVSADGQTFWLNAFSEKRGMVVFLCEPSSDGAIPDYSIRRKIERQVTKSHHEHLIIYLDADRNKQIWQWVKREAGKPAACREHTYYAYQPGDSLIQKINNLAFSLEEEEQLTIFEVGKRARKAFDVEKVTKRFYDRFKAEHGKFLKFLKGIPEEKFQRWHVSVMLNRLMFIYFIQKKGFLDNDNNYLLSRLNKSKQRGKDKYYKDFLCPLFFEGFAKREEDREPETNKLLGKVPYLDGGLFQEHQVEKLYGKDIQIEDAAFDNLFSFFDEYNWHLDERPLKADNEINPDVLGYIFEKYINQKQMGAYYTKEDITGYISKNTIIPFLFDQAQKKCKIAFEGEQSIWQLLKEDPDRYIFDAVKKGVDLLLPEEIEVGIRDVPKRTEWNKPAPPEYALPTEIWREVVARRQRYEEVCDKLSKGEIRSINDLITYNLDIRQFGQDVIENCEGPELLRAIYYTIAGRIPDKSNQEFQPGMSVLDPTCGSGAFLFAALNILEPLYEACLDRMQVFLDELESSSQKHRSDKYGDFRKILERIVQHPNRRYFILKSIILNNLYGVDIMEEATEICKLRLFLKLVAQVDSVDKIEPLPDIDFNIRAGNTLVGFATRDEVKEAITSSEAGKQKQGKLQFGEYVETLKKLEEKAQGVEQLFNLFREQQTELGGVVTSSDKQALINRLKELEDELDRYLAFEYGINQGNIRDIKEYEKRFTQWRESHHPFHWFIEFYGIMKDGGFDVIIGNPPYVEYRKVKQKYTINKYRTESCSNLYAFIIERNNSLLSNQGYSGMIVPHSAFCTDRMAPVINLFAAKMITWISTYSIRPSKLFVGVDQRLAIYLTTRSSKIQIYNTMYNHWQEDFRPHLFKLLKYQLINTLNYPGSFPKVGFKIEEKIWQKLHSQSEMAISFYGSSNIYYHNAPRYWVRAMTFAPYFWNERDGEQISSHTKTLCLPSRDEAKVITAILNSSLFYWWFLLLSNCRDLSLREIERLPLKIDKVDGYTKKKMGILCDQLMKSYNKNSFRKECQYKATGKVVYDEYYPRYSKPILDEIDRLLAEHYGLTEEELDFIINYDVKYRMGLI